MVNKECKKPDACEWNWWPDHCQCRSSEGKRVDAPEPGDMVARNLRSTISERDRELRVKDETIKFAAEHIGKLEAELKKLRPKPECTCHGSARVLPGCPRHDPEGNLQQLMQSR